MSKYFPATFFFPQLIQVNTSTSTMDDSWGRDLNEIKIMVEEELSKGYFPGHFNTLPKESGQLELNNCVILTNNNISFLAALMNNSECLFNSCLEN